MLSSGCNERKEFKYKLSMKDSKHRITNLFWLKSSKRLRILDSCSLQTKVRQTNLSGVDNNDYLNTLYWVIDAYKKNSNHTGTISALSITVESAPQIMDQIREWQQNRESIKGVDAADVLKFIYAEYTAISSGMEWDSEDDDVMNQKWEII